MKTYLKSLLPFRWIYVLIFILSTTVVIAMGFGSEDPINPEYFTNRVVWYGGNILLWILVDYFFGLGQKCLWERNNNTKTKQS